MSKGLDALKSLGEHHCSLIQKYESEVCRIPCHECKYLKEEEIIRKGLKAMEIVKNKKVHINLIINCKNVDDYNKNLLMTHFKKDAKQMYLTQEEYDLLKEVLL